MKNVELENIEPEYIHSSNSVINFMKELWYLEDILKTKRIMPRYCEENIEYLELKYNGEKIKTVCVLQKCFCDIPLHSITKTVPVWNMEQDINGGEEVQKSNLNSTHTDFYGEYGIAFSKTWAEKNNLQPVQYINPNSTVVEDFKKVFEYVLNREDIDDVFVSDIISRLGIFKQLCGKMSRLIDGNKINVIKNFRDECEWRYIPTTQVLEKYHLSLVIFDEETKKLRDQISNRLLSEHYKELGIPFEFQEIRYVVVPNTNARRNLIDFITSLELDIKDALLEKSLLISKILVLDDIKRDF